MTQHSVVLVQKVLLEAKNFTKEIEIYPSLITGGLYILNIIDANIDAHLLQFNVSDNLTLKPKFNKIF